MNEGLGITLVGEVYGRFNFVSMKRNPYMLWPLSELEKFSNLPKSLVELNSVLLKVTFGSYKFFGFFKRANYNSNRNLGEMSVYL